MARLLYDLVGAEDAQRFSPFCWRSKMALLHKGLAFDTHPVHFTDKEELTFSGQGKVPILVDGDSVVVDSWDIADYLETQYPDRPTLFPGGGRAQTWFFKHWCEQQIQPLILRIVLPELFKRIAEKDRSYFRSSRETRFGCTLEEAAVPLDTGVHDLQSRLKPAQETLKRYPWLSGDEPGFADYILFGAFQWARIMSPVSLIANQDALAEWFDRLLDAFDGYAREAPRAT